jgi:YlmC/YmxH family sporulation protein
MHLSDLQNKDIVNIKDGKKIGNIVDVTIDNNGYMISFIIQKNKFNINIFKNNNEEEIKWKQIKKIGEDVILVDTQI